MLLDKQSMFCDNQLVTSTVYSANSVYFGKNDVSYMPLIIQVTSDFVGATSVVVEFETCSNIAFISTTVIGSCTLTGSKLVAGAKFPISHLPKGNLGYIRLKFIVSGSATAGKITAGVVLNDSLSWHEV